MSEPQFQADEIAACRRIVGDLLSTSDLLVAVGAELRIEAVVLEPGEYVVAGGRQPGVRNATPREGEEARGQRIRERQLSEFHVSRILDVGGGAVGEAGEAPRRGGGIGPETWSDVEIEIGEVDRVPAAAPIDQAKEPDR